MPEFDTVRWSFDDDAGIGRLVLDRPDSLNALSGRLRGEIVAAFEAFEELDGEADGVAVRAVTVEGAGDRAFCAGADLEEMDETAPGVLDPADEYEAPESFDAPVVAKIDGYCLGGGLEFAMACDFRIASARSTLGQPEVDLGFIPGGGGTQRLARLAGPSRAKELCMTGEHVDADRALEDGILDYVYPADELDDRVEAFARRLADGPPLAVRAVKDVVDMSSQVGLREGRRYERRANRMLRATEDHREAARAREEGREPVWKGK